MDRIVKYLSSSSCIAFNGGKDSTVVLYLILDICHANNQPVPPCIFYDDPDEFPEVQSFVHNTIVKHNLQLITYTCSYKESMTDLSAQGFRTIFMGQRIGDPYCDELTLVQPVSYLTHQSNL